MKFRIKNDLWVSLKHSRCNIVHCPEIQNVEVHPRSRESHAPISSAYDLRQ